jgi:hypothetical protein
VFLRRLRDRQRYLQRVLTVMRLLQNLKRNIIATTAGIILVVAAVIALTVQYSEPKPLSDDELVKVHNAIQAVAPGNIGNLQLNRDASVTAFVTSGHYSKQSVVAKKVGDKWTASVTMVYF